MQGYNVRHLTFCGVYMETKRKIGPEVRSLSNLIKRCCDSEKPAEIEGLTGIHCLVLHFLYDNRGTDVFQRDFEERFCIRRSTVTNILNLMERNGMIRRERIDGDARLKKIVLTDKAIEIHNGIVSSVNACEDRIVNNITASELKTFFTVLDKMKKNLEGNDD